MSHGRRLASAVALLVALTSTIAAKPAVVPVAERLDRIAASTYPANEPGAAILVLRDGKPLLRKAYGMADLELGVPLAVDGVFRIASITKQFTAVAILQLVQQGKLSIEDDITEFFPDYPTGGRKITIEHLLTHTSGIRSYTSMESYDRLKRTDLTPLELIDAFKNEPADFAPGEKWFYNNSGYVLLGAIIEKVSGISYADYAQKNLLIPAGMTESRYADDAKIIPRRVRGYDRGENGFINAGYLSMTLPYAAGALLSTVDDLAKWQAAVEEGKVVDRKLLDRAWTPYIVAGGRSSNYGFGWAINRHHGLRLIEHAGDIDGFSSYGLAVPEKKIYIAILANRQDPVVRPEDVATALLDELLGIPPRKPITLDAARLEEYVGVYRFDEETTRTITREGNRLFSQRSGSTRLEILPLGDDEFLFAESGQKAYFSRDAKSRVTTMGLRARYGGDHVGVREAGTGER
jgi:CubicO group peptidase (beta-lactamase class C family)